MCLFVDVSQLCNSVENKRRTKYIAETTNPDWAQTVVYKDVHSLASVYLELTVWDYDKFGQNLFLGQVIIPLNGARFTPFS